MKELLTVVVVSMELWASEDGVAGRIRAGVSVLVAVCVCVCVYVTWSFLLSHALKNCIQNSAVLLC